MARADIPKVPQTLLLADDSLTIQRVIELTFADEDIDVVAVSDGDQAIARLDSLPPDIVLVDVGMPGKSGYEVAAYVIVVMPSFVIATLADAPATVVAPKA